MFHQVVFMLCYCVYARILQPVDGGMQGGDSHKVGCAGLELERKIGERSPVKAHVAYHLAPALVWRHHFEPLALAVEHPHTGRSVHLVR